MQQGYPFSMELKESLYPTMELVSSTMFQLQSLVSKRYIFYFIFSVITLFQPVIPQTKLINSLCCETQVVKATQGRIPVFLDGGVRRGTDVFKALALGASGVFVSRLSLQHYVY